MEKVNYSEEFREKRKKYRGFFEQFDHFPHELTIPLRESDGFRSYCGGILSIVFFFVVMSGILTEFYRAVMTWNDPVIESEFNTLLSQNISFGNDTEHQFVGPLMMTFMVNFDCVQLDLTSDKTSLIAKGNRECFFDKDKLESFKYIVSNVDGTFGGGSFSGPFDIIETAEECTKNQIKSPEVVYQFEKIRVRYKEWVQANLNMPLEASDDFMANLTACFNLPNLNRTQTTYNEIYFFVNPSFKFNIEKYESMNECQHRVATEVMDIFPSLRGFEHAYSDSEDIDQIGVELEKTYYLKSAQNLGYMIGSQECIDSVQTAAFLFYFRVLGLNPEIESQDTRPFQFHYIEAPITYSTFPKGQIVFNDHLFKEVSIKLQETTVTSNYGMGFFWRSEKEWSFPELSSYQLLESVGLDYYPGLGHKILTLQTNPSKKTYSIQYAPLLNMYSTLGGYLSIIEYFVFLILSFNRFKMLIYYYRRFKVSKTKMKSIASDVDSQKEEERSHVVTGTFCEYIRYIIGGFCCCDCLKRKFHSNIDLDAFEEELFRTIDLRVLVTETRRNLPAEDQLNIENVISNENDEMIDENGDEIQEVQSGQKNQEQKKVEKEDNDAFEEYNKEFSKTQEMI